LNERGRPDAAFAPLQLAVPSEKLKLFKILKLLTGIMEFMVMTIAQELASIKVTRMAEVEGRGGVWSEDGFVFPDGSRGAFNGEEAYRDEHGMLRLRPRFAANGENPARLCA